MEVRLDANAKEGYTTESKCNETQKQRGTNATKCKRNGNAAQHKRNPAKTFLKHEHNLFFLEKNLGEQTNVSRIRWGGGWA